MKLPFTGKDKIITVLEMDENFLKMVQLRPSPREKKIFRSVVKKINGISENELIKMITGLSKQFKIDPDHLIISMPTQFATIRNPEFPSLDSEEIKDMVELQIGKQTPYSTNEIVSDYQIVYTSPDGYSRVMLVIVHIDIVNRYFRVLEKAGLKPARIGLSSEGTLNWCRLSYQEKKVEDEPYLLVDVDNTESNFIAILNNKIIFDRNISLGFSQSVEDMDKWQKELIEEINRSIYAYQNEMVNKDISKIVIGGSERVTAKLNDNLLRESFNLPVEITPQFKNIPVTKEALDLYGGDLKDISLSSLIGLAFIYGKEHINLLPHEIKLERTMKKRAKDLYLLGILLALILIATSSVFLEKFYSRERYLTQLKNKIASIKGEADDLGLMKEKMEIVKSRSDAKGSVLNILYEAYNVISPDMYLLSVSFDGKHILTLRGSSSVMSEVFKFVNELEKSEYFENVKTKYVSKNIVKGEETAEFEIICPLSAALQRLLREY